MKLLENFIVIIKPCQEQLAEQPNTEEIISKLYTARLMEDNLRIFRQKTGLYY